MRFMNMELEEITIWLIPGILSLKWKRRERRTGQLRSEGVP
ncbi:hypothetical protein [Tumebacillus lipolyticus]|uniref:Uncharacterized protein n=1 Tax=Tumebacillus lipolyticus TaxID=1280370 RepID=A0ABW5A0V6_9BACL